MVTIDAARGLLFTTPQSLKHEGAPITFNTRSLGVLACFLRLRNKRGCMLDEGRVLSTGAFMAGCVASVLGINFNSTNGLQLG